MSSHGARRYIRSVYKQTSIIMTTDDILVNFMLNDNEIFYLEVETMYVDLHNVYNLFICKF